MSRRGDIILPCSWRCADRRYLIRPVGSTSPGMDLVQGECLWDRRYSVTPPDLECVLTYCRHPHTEPGSHPAPPLQNSLSLVQVSNWSIPLGDTITYRCAGSDQYFESNETDPLVSSLTVECLAGVGEYDTPVRQGGLWPNCTSTVLCDPPPEPPFNGSYSWTSELTYNTSVTYLCQARNLEI